MLWMASVTLDSMREPSRYVLLGELPDVGKGIDKLLADLTEEDRQGATLVVIPFDLRNLSPEASKSMFHLANNERGIFKGVVTH